MLAQIHTYYGETLTQVKTIELPDNYNDDPYGDTITFSVGSNQMIVTEIYNFRCEYCNKLCSQHIENECICESCNKQLSI